jgi:hypothetical protein
VEAISDVIFVYIMVRYFAVPMLSAIPKVEIFSVDNMASSLVMALTLNAMGVCVAMAAHIEL